MGEFLDFFLVLIALAFIAFCAAAIVTAILEVEDLWK